MKVVSWTGHRPDGTPFSYPRDAPCLTDDALPTNFPNLAPYLSTILPAKRTHPDERRAAVKARDEHVLQSWLDEDAIASFDVLKSEVASKFEDANGDWKD